jgi:hypothetical protein
MFEICLKRGWAVPARAALDLCKMVEKRMYVPPVLWALTSMLNILLTGGVR